MRYASRCVRGVLVAFVLVVAAGTGSALEFDLPIEQARELQQQLEKAALRWDGAANAIEVQGRALNDEDFARIAHFRRGAEEIRQAAALLADRIARGDVRLRGEEARLLRHAKELAEGGPERYPGPSKVPGQPPAIDLERELRGESVEAGKPESRADERREPLARYRRLRERRELERAARRLSIEVRLMQIRARLRELELERIKLRLEAMELEQAREKLESAGDAAAWRVVYGPALGETKPLWVLEQVFVGPPRDWERIHAHLFETAREHGLEVTGPVIHRYERIGGPDGRWVTRIALGVHGEKLEPWATKDVELRRLPARKVLRLKCKGPYERTWKEARERLELELQRRGLEPAGPFEVWYYDDPRETPEPSQTAEAMVPVR